MRSIALLLCASCTCGESVDPEPVRLDVPLAPGEVRAGRMRAESELIGGLTARARVGDFKMYNDRIAVTIAQESTAIGFHPYGGVILDADVIRAPGTPGAPGASAFGEIVIGFDFQVLRTESITVVDDGRSGSGEARLRVTGRDGPLPIFGALIGDLFAPESRELEWSLDYVLEAGADHVRIEYTLQNRGDSDLELAPLAGFFFGTGADPFVEGAGFGGTTNSADWYGAASTEVSYAYGRSAAQIGVVFSESGLAVATLGDAVELRAREKKTLVDRLVIGDGDLARTRARYRELTGAPLAASLEGQTVDALGAPIAGVRLHVLQGEDYVVRSVSDAEGRFAIAVDEGGAAYQLVAVTDGGVASDPIEIELGRAIEVRIPATGRLDWTVLEGAAPLPSKISVAPLDAAPRVLPRSFGEREHGASLARTEFTTGSGGVELPPGRYLVYASRGGEYEVASATVTIAAGATARFDAALVRSVRSTNWLTAEPHVHAQLSSDSRDLYPFKVMAMVAENIELPVSTDHEWIGDFEPAIAELGLERFIRGITGTEISTVRYGHFNAFPLEQDRSKPGFGRVLWYGLPPGDTFALVRARPEDPYLQANHPRSTTIGYFELLGLDRDTLAAARSDFSFDLDGIEVVNGCDQAVLDGSTVLDWFSFLNHGRRIAATASLDDHTAGRGEMGFPVTYVHLPVDAPREVEPTALRDAFRAGRLSVSCGPFIEMRIGAAEIGDLVPSEGSSVEVSVRVEAASWVDVDRLYLIAGGSTVRTIALAGRDPIRFDGTVTATVSGVDPWIIGWVEGDSRHGVWAQHRRSAAFTNPIFIDSDGDGRWR